MKFFNQLPKTFLIFLQNMPQVIYNIQFEGCHIKSEMISVDLKIAEVLRNI